MSRLIKFFILIGFIVTTLSSFADPAKSIMVSKKQPEFTITLASNPTTGYSWFIKKYNPALVQIVKHVYRPPVNALVGAGGTEIWTLKLKPAAFTAPQLTKISFIYARGWDITDNPTKTEFTVVSVAN